MARSSRSPDGNVRQKSIGSMTFSAMVSVGSSWKNWNTTPMVFPRQRASRFSSSSCTGVPSTTTEPEVGRSMPVTMFTERRLARPRLADQADELAGVHRRGPRTRSASNGTSPVS